jgi:hypothetical protein
MSDPSPSGSGSRSGKQDFAGWGEARAQHLLGPVATGVRQKIAQWRDPRARLLRRRRRAKRTAVAAGAATGVLGGGTVASLSPHVFGPPLGSAVLETLLDVASVGSGGLAVVAGIGTITAWLRYRTLKNVPLPAAAPMPVPLPPSGSQAREPMQRLRDAEQSLHGVLLQLTAVGTGVDSVPDVRGSADDAAVAMRQVADRLRAVEAALPHTPEDERPVLEGEVRRLRRELDEGVDGYGRLVAAAGRAVAASGAPDQTRPVQDATDRLVGLAAALRELSGATSTPHDADGIHRQGPEPRG